MRRIRLAGLLAAGSMLAALAPTATASRSPGDLSWLTPELVARADAARGVGVPLPAGAPFPASSVAFTGIRPGTLLVFLFPFSPALGCTANFVFQTTAGAFDPSQQLYLGTAGHCVGLGQNVQAVAVAPGTSRPVLATVGPVVVDDDVADFALIKVDPALNAWVSPSMAHWGGPTGVNTSTASQVATQTGHGVVVGTGGTPRIGMGSMSGGGVSFTSVIAQGDSGSPLTTVDGLAMGSIVGLNSTTPGAWISGRGPSIGTMLTLAGKPLATCPTRTSWPLPGCPPV